MEENREKRAQLAQQVLKADKDEALHIVVLQPMFSWAMRRNIEVVARPDNRLTLEWVSIR